jgi:hypothetical protein
MEMERERGVVIAPMAPRRKGSHPIRHPILRSQLPPSPSYLLDNQTVWPHHKGATSALVTLRGN